MAQRFVNVLPFKPQENKILLKVELGDHNEAKKLFAQDGGPRSASLIDGF